MIIRYWLILLAAVHAIGQHLPAQTPTADAPIVVPPVVEKVDFERHVAPLFSRLGCNAGACHGSFEGKGGFLRQLGFPPTQTMLTRSGRPVPIFKKGSVIPALTIG